LLSCLDRLFRRWACRGRPRRVHGLHLITLRVQAPNPRPRCGLCRRPRAAIDGGTTRGGVHTALEQHRQRAGARQQQGMSKLSGQGRPGLEPDPEPGLECRRPPLQALGPDPGGRRSPCRAWPHFGLQLIQQDPTGNSRTPAPSPEPGRGRCRLGRRSRRRGGGRGLPRLGLVCRNCRIANGTSGSFFSLWH